MEDLDPVIDGEQDADADTRTDLEILEDDGEEKGEAKPKPVVDVKEKKPVKKEAPVEEEEEEEESEEEKEEEVEEEEEEEPDVDVPEASPEYRDVKKKYPALFKDFPGLRHDFFRVKAFDKLFTSVDEAKEVAERFDGLVEVEKVVASGNAEKMIQGLGQYSKPALAKFAHDFLPNLFKQDKELHEQVAGDLFSRVLRSAQTQARSSGNKNLYHAAAHLSMYLWNKEQIPEVATRTAPDLEIQRRELEEREQRFFTTRNNEFSQDVKSTGERQLRKEVSRGLDPDGVFPDFVVDSILDKVMSEVDYTMSTDEQHIKNMNVLWEKAARMGQGKDFKNRLIQQYISRARSLVGPIRRKLVSEAIAKINKKPGGASSATTKKVVPGGGTPKAGAARPSPKDVDWSKTSDLDYLNRDIKSRK